MGDRNNQQKESFRRLIRVGVLCNNTEITKNEKTGHVTYTSDPTEQAIFKFTLGNLEDCLSKHGQAYTDFRKVHYPQAGEGAKIPFNSANKWAVSVHKIATEEATFKGENVGDSVVVIKGAPERILNMCGYYVHEGEDQELT